MVTIRNFLIAWVIIAPVLGLIGTDDISLSPGEINNVDSFAFEKGGKYSVGVTTKSPSNSTPSVILFVIEKGENCQTIAKRCTFAFFKSSSVCNSLFSSSIYNNVVGIYPIVVPAEVYQTVDKSTTFQINVSSWLPSQSQNLTMLGLTEEQLDNITLGEYLNTVVTPTIVTNLGSSLYVLNASDVTTPVESFTSNIVGTTSSSVYLAFGLISCINITIESVPSLTVIIVWSCRTSS